MVQEDFFHLTGEIHNSPDTGLPWFFHRVGVNKLVLDLNGIHRVDFVTAPIAYKVMEDHLLMEGWLHIHKDLFDTVPQCMHVDMWTLAFWKRWRSKWAHGHEEHLLPEKCSQHDGHLREGELPMALLTPDAFGHSITSCMTAQLDAIQVLLGHKS